MTEINDDFDFDFDFEFEKNLDDKKKKDENLKDESRKPSSSFIERLKRKRGTEAEEEVEADEDTEKETKEKNKKEKNTKQPRDIEFKLEDEDDNESIDKRLISEYRDRIEMSGNRTYLKDLSLEECKGKLEIIVENCEKINESQKRIFLSKLKSFIPVSSFYSRNADYKTKISITNAQYINSFINSQMEELEIEEHIDSVNILNALRELKEIVQVAEYLKNEYSLNLKLGNVCYV